MESSRDIYYYYDENGAPIGLNWNNTDYFYYKNMFGDVLGIMNSNGSMVVRYSYDAWGNPISTTGSMSSTLGQDNPFRYRGYYYDTETGLYYLNARYYNPEWCRFISADPVLDTSSAVGCNMFAYCGNDPVNRSDPSGEWWIGGSLLDFVEALISGVNYFYNWSKEIDPATSTFNAIINDQNLRTGESYMYGFFHGSYNACEAIAIHNAKVLLGKDSVLTEVIRDIQDTDGMMLFGVLGSSPMGIGKVLKKNNISYSEVELNEINKPGIYIISYWTNKPVFLGISSIHTVTIKYDGETFTTYNKRGDGSVCIDSPSSYAKKYICGYYLGGA